MRFLSASWVMDSSCCESWRRCSSNIFTALGGLKQQQREEVEERVKCGECLLSHCLLLLSANPPRTSSART
jgi:hypothetical protein